MMSFMKVLDDFLNDLFHDFYDDFLIIKKQLND